MRQGRRERRSHFSPKPRPSHAKSRSLRVELLEPRQMLSGVSPLAVQSATSGSLAPEVYVGDDLQVDLAQPALLDGTVMLKSGHPSSLVTAWSKVTGPGDVTFAEAAAIDTTARFSDPGTYVLRLEANDGVHVGSDELTLIVTEVQPPDPPTSVFLEAELATSVAPMMTRSHADASGGQYVASATSEQGTVRFEFDVEQAGEYVVSARVLAPSANQDSFFVSIDGGPEDVFDAAEGTWGSEWQWMVLNGRGGTGRPLALNPRILTLSPGHHTLTFRGREAGTGLDRIMITQETGSVPNQAPVVDAGMDQRILVSAALVLAGAATDDGQPPAPGTLTTTWSAVSGPGDVTFDDASATSTSARFSAPGTYVLRLEANDGELVGSDELTVTVDSPPPPTSGPILLEAESGTLTAPMAKRSHPDAIGGEYVSADSAQQGTVQFTFDVDEAGDYVISARVLATASNQDSFFVSLDGGAEDVFDVAEGKWSSLWQWTAVNGRGATGQPLAENPRIFALTPGRHTLTFRSREAGAGLDQILITKDLDLAPNQAPAVAAGDDHRVLISAALSLDGTVADDGLPNPPGALTTMWNKVSGPGEVAFGDRSAVDTTAQFSAPGTYVLRLDAHDGELTGSDEVTVTVAEVPQSLNGFYVAPNGSSQGDGSAENPWDLQTALSHPAAVKPGDTIWLRGGTYRGGFTSKLTGTADNPITVRAYPGEHVRIDTNGPANGTDRYFNFYGGYTHYWGFEVMSSDPGSRVTTESGSSPSSINRGSLYNYGDHNKFINLVLHDLTNGIGFWSGGEGGEIYGSIIYNNGWVAPDRQHGHGIYTQNEYDTKRIADNVLFSNFQIGIKIYSEKGSMRGFDLEGNTVFNAGAGAGEGFEKSRNILIGGGTPAENITLKDNYTYQAGPHQGVVELGYGSNTNTNLTLTDNYFTGDLRFRRAWSPITASGNTLVGRIVKMYNGQPPSSGITVVEQPQGTQVFVQPNEYEPGRANITVYNWDESPSVDVDLSTVLTVGAAYEVHSVTDLFGTPVVGGVYDGKPIRVPMRAMTPPRPIGGESLGDPVAIGPEFGVFVVTTSTAPQELQAAAGPVTAGANLERLTPEMLSPIVEYAVSQWATMGLSDAKMGALQKVHVRIGDLDGGALGLTTAGVITLDDDAAGYGWFADPTPELDEEFILSNDTELVSRGNSPAARRMDLLSAVMHELGHVLGYEHPQGSHQSGSLMTDTLPTGIRRGLGRDAVDAVLMGELW